MNVRCSSCGTVYRVDPAKVPPGGVRARCARCPNVIQVERISESPAEAVLPAIAEPSEATAAHPSERTEPAAQPGLAEPARPALAEPSARPGLTEPSAPSETAFAFTDPHERARRLARALVSDIVAYHGERRDRSLREGTLRHELGEEIRKSWEEYASQVGNQFARETSYFRDALNEILAPGAGLF